VASSAPRGSSHPADPPLISFMDSRIASTAVLLGVLAGCGPESYWLNGDGGTAGAQGGGLGGHLGGVGGSNGTGGRGAGGADAGAPEVPPAVAVRFDFESTSSLDGWQPVGGRPADMVDQVVRSTDAFHHGAGALAAVFDGQYTPLGASDSAYYGVYTNTNPPPPSAVVSIWTMATAPGVSLQIYTQTKPSYLWQGLALSETLVPNVWTKVTATMPAAEAFYFGCIINSPFDMAGTVYFDDISW
jgi:hypothetical protein